MTNKLWCQMCGKTVGDEIFPRLSNCQWCGAVLVEAPSKDGLLEEVLLTQLAKRDALIEKLIEVGSAPVEYVRRFARYAWKGELATSSHDWQSLVDGWRGSK